MEYEFAMAVAKEAIRDLWNYGNFDEFRDHREADEINCGAAEIIASALMGEFDKRAKLRMAQEQGEPGRCS